MKRPLKRNLPLKLQNRLNELQKQSNTVFTALPDFLLAQELMEKYDVDRPAKGSLSIYAGADHHTIYMDMWVNRYREGLPLLRELRRRSGKKIKLHYHDTIKGCRSYNLDSFYLTLNFFHKEGSTCEYVEVGKEVVPIKKMLCGDKLEAWKLLNEGKEVTV